MIVAVIPAYNEEKTIAKVILLTQRHAEKVIVCDDGSTDMTGEIAKTLNVEVLRHERNLGKGAALRTLFSKALKLKPKVVVTLDSDGQHNPEQIPVLAEPIISGEADIVIGSRFAPGAETDIPLYRRMGLAAVNWLNRTASNSKVKDTQSGFRAYSLEALKTVASYESNGYGAEGEQLTIAAKNGLRTMEVPIAIKYKGLVKTSKKRPEAHVLELVGSILRLVVEERPLVFLGIPGVVSLIIGSWFGILMLHYYTTERYIITNIALASVAFILLGIFTLFTAITLYAIVRLFQKTSKQ